MGSDTSAGDMFTVYNQIIDSRYVQTPDHCSAPRPPPACPVVVLMVGARAASCCPALASPCSGGSGQQPGRSSPSSRQPLDSLQPSLQIDNLSSVHHPLSRVHHPLSMQNLDSLQEASPRHQRVWKMTIIWRRIMEWWKIEGAIQLDSTIKQ